MYMCKACGDLFDDMYDKCPKSSCNGGYIEFCGDDENDIDNQVNDIIHVDDAFAPVIQMLHKKGYDIASAYFGNAVNMLRGCPEIVFDDILFDVMGKRQLEETFSDVPAPWKFQVNNGHPILTAFIFERDAIERYRALLIAHAALADWVENAKEIDY